jgi:DNA invertase Pin-like site-specific DNA recombinase
LVDFQKGSWLKIKRDQDVRKGASTSNFKTALVRQVLGAIAQFDKAATVVKLKAARDRKIAAGEKCGGRKNYAERDPELVNLARQLHRPDPER